MSALQVRVQPPEGFAPGTPASFAADYKLDRSFKSQGDVFQRMSFRENLGLLCGLLESLCEVQCSGKLTVTIGGASYAIEGTLEAWTAPAQTIILQTMQRMLDCAAAMARNPKSSAQIVYTLDRALIPTMKH